MSRAVSVNIFEEKERASPSSAVQELFWYSRPAALLILSFLFLLVQSTSSLIPPFQSPDEFNHLKRAYLLSGGEVLFDSENGQTGGWIDSGLLEYMRCFEHIPFNYAAKMTASVLKHCDRISWSDKKVFSEFANTAAYFPLPYLPQAAALVVGRRLSLSVGNTYFLARLLCLLSTLALLYGALLLYPVPLVVISLFGMPMTLFQMASTSLDSITFSLSALAGCLFMRGSDPRFTFNGYLQAALTLCLLLLATSRMIFITLAFLPSVLYTNRRSKIHIASAAVILLFSLCWILYVQHTVRGTTAPQALAPISIARYYLMNVDALVEVFVATLGNGHILHGYWNMFVGVLGWLDTPLGSVTYLVFAVLLLILGCISITHEKSQIMSAASLSLLIGSLASIFLLFLIELVTWTPHPAQVIEGVQGRYFYPILIFMSFPLFGRPLSRFAIRLGFCILILLAVFSIATVQVRSLNRYWIADVLLPSEAPGIGHSAGIHDLATTQHVQSSRAVSTLLTMLDRPTPTGSP